MEGLQSKVAKVTLISSVQQSFSVTFLVVEIIKMVRVYFPPHCHLMRLWLLLLKKKKKRWLIKLGLYIFKMSVEVQRHLCQWCVPLRWYQHLLCRHLLGCFILLAETWATKKKNCFKNKCVVIWDTEVMNHNYIQTQISSFVLVFLMLFVRYNGIQCDLFKQQFLWLFFPLYLCGEPKFSPWLTLWRNWWRYICTH